MNTTLMIFVAIIVIILLVSVIFYFKNRKKRKDIENSVEHNDIGIELLKMHNYEKAIEEFRSASELDPKNPVFFHN